MTKKDRKHRIAVWRMIFIGIFITSGFAMQVYAQSEDKVILATHNQEVKSFHDIIVTINVQNSTLLNIFNLLEEQMGFHFTFNNEIISNSKHLLDLNYKNEYAADVLKEIASLTGLTFQQINRIISVGVHDIREPVTKTDEEIFSETVTGKVTDAETGESLPGVNISVKGLNIGTTTNFTGDFELNVPSLSDTLIVSFVRYQRQEVPIDGVVVLNIELIQEIIRGQELIVVGYNTQRREDLTGAISVVDIESFARGSSGQISKELQGRASGVTITSSGQPGEPADIRIRGINTFGNNSPLFVVDGNPSDNIDNINPQDVESIQVLKDAAATSIYGARASNGVILITTKKGRGAMQINYNGTTGYDIPKRGNVWNLLDPQGQADLIWFAHRNSGVTPGDEFYGFGASPVLPEFTTPRGNVNLDDYNIDPNYTDASALNNFFRITRANHKGTNWYEEVFQPALTMNHDLSVSGGSENTTYLISLSHLNHKGTMLQTFFERSTIRTNTSYTFNDVFRIGQNLSFSIAENPREGTGSGGIVNTYLAEPIMPVYDVMGNYAGTFGIPTSTGGNPVAIQERKRNNRDIDTRLFGNIFAEADVLDVLTFRTSFGGNFSSRTNRSFTFPTYENNANNPLNRFSTQSQLGYNWTWTNLVSYQNNFTNIHSIEILVGTELFQNKIEQSINASVDAFPSFDPNFTNLSTGTTNRQVAGFSLENSLASYFTKIDYSYDSRYLISATLRRDGSSKFLNQKWGWFPAASLGWRISSEEFFDISWITNLMIRGSYGVVGNELNVDANNSFTLFTQNQGTSFYDVTGSNRQIQPGFQQLRIGNPDAKWERNENLNFGIDASLFDGSVEFMVEYYRKDVNDLLFNPQLLATVGKATPPFVNIANMKNTGIDAELSYFGNRGGDLSYNVNFTFTSYTNEILKVSNNADFFETRPFGGTNLIRNEVGHSMSGFYGFQIVGFWQSQQEIDEANAQAGGTYQTDAGVGRFRYADINGDGRIDFDDRTFLGNPNPDFTYGLDIGVNYKQFDINMFLFGSQGNDIFNNVIWSTDFYANFAGAKSKSALNDSWTPDNRNASLPIQELTGGFSTADVPNSYFIEDGSFLKLKNLTVGYTFSQNTTQMFGASNLRIYVQGANLFTITGYSGLDPEIPGGSVTNFGVDNGIFAQPRRILAGINLTF